MGVREGINKLDVCKEKIEINRYCSQDLSKVQTQSGVLSRSFSVADLSTPDKLQVHVRTYVDYFGGYSQHGKEILFGLEDSGRCVVKLTPIKSLIDIDPFIMQRCSHLINPPGFDIDKSVFLTIAGPGWAQEKFISKSRFNIMWTMIESRNCHPMMREWLRNVNEIWCPTNTDKIRFDNLLVYRSDKINLKIMRLGYDPSLYNPHIPQISISNLKNRYVFGVVGSWNKRKGIEKIIRAFCNEFKSSENVSLLLVSRYATRPYDGIKMGEEVKKDDKEKWDIKYEFNRIIEDRKNIPHICLIDIPIQESVLPTIYARINCLIGFSMGESSWLPGLQAFGMRKPVIQLQSDCSGFMDYMNDDNSYLCKDVEYVKADDELVLGTSEYYEGQEFAEGTELELCAMMRRVYEERRDKRHKIKCENAFETVKDKWTWKESVRNVINRLQEIKNGS